MYFAASTIAAVLAFTSLAAATHVQARQDTLQDWQVTSVNSHTPSGRPGSYPWSSITANITDPNAINLGTSASDGTAVIIPAGSQGLACFSNYEQSIAY